MKVGDCLLFYLYFFSHLKHDDCDYNQEQESHYNSGDNDQHLIWEYYELNTNFSLLAEQIKVLWDQGLF